MPGKVLIQSKLNSEHYRVCAMSIIVFARKEKLFSNLKEMRV